MKRIIALLMSVMLIFTAVSPIVSATSVESDTERFDDGSYMTVTYIRPPSASMPDDDETGDEGVWEDTDAAEESTPSALTRLLLWFKDILNKILGKQSTVTKTKYCNYFSSNGELLWSVCLKGKFTYNHRKAICVSSEINYEIRDSDWKILSCSSTEDGNAAKGEFSIRQYKLGVPLKLIEKSLTLTCDKDGNVK